jgi:hypothetical protein
MIKSPFLVAFENELGLVIFFFKIIYKKKPFIMNSFKFKEIIVYENFQVENGGLELVRDIYLSIIKFLDSSILRKV